MSASKCDDPITSRHSILVIQYLNIMIFCTSDTRGSTVHGTRICYATKIHFFRTSTHMVITHIHICIKKLLHIRFLNFCQ